MLSLWAGRNPVNDKRVVRIERPCSHGALPNQSHPALNGTEWKCVCQGGGDSLCISKTAKGFYAKCKLQPESYRSTKLLRTSDGGLSKQISLRELAYTVTFQSIFKVLLAPDRRWERQFHLLIMRGFGGRGIFSSEVWRKAMQNSKRHRAAPFLVWQPALIRPFFFFCHRTVPARSQRNSSLAN